MFGMFDQSLCEPFVFNPDLGTGANLPPLLLGVAPRHLRNITPEEATRKDWEEVSPGTETETRQSAEPHIDLGSLGVYRLAC